MIWNDFYTCNQQEFKTHTNNDSLSHKKEKELTARKKPAAAMESGTAHLYERIQYRNCSKVAKLQHIHQ